MKTLLLRPLLALSLYIFVSLLLVSPAVAQGSYQCLTNGFNCTPIGSCTASHVPGPCVYDAATGVCKPDSPQACVSATGTPTPTPSPTASPSPTATPPPSGYYTCEVDSATGGCQVQNNYCGAWSAPGSCPVPGRACDSSISGFCVSATGTPTPTPSPPPSGYYTCDWDMGTSTCKVKDINCNSPNIPGPCPVPWQPCLSTFHGTCISPVPTVTVTGTPTPTPYPSACDPSPFPAPGLQTMLGCIPTTIQNLIPWAMRLIMGVAGGICLLLLIYGGIAFIMAGGDPKAMEEAKEVITAAVTGFALIIFSVLILKIIGVDILGVPGISVTPSGGIEFPSGTQQ